MTRLLIVITRMYAKQGDSRLDGDEFVSVWGQPKAEPHRVFACEAGGRSYHVVLVHGYEYPQEVDDAVARARAAVAAGLAATGLGAGLSGAKVGFVCHARLAWKEEEKSAFLRGMKECLESSGLDVAFVKRYSYDRRLPLVSALAPQCRREPKDFSGEFILTWNYFFLREKARDSKHSVNSLFNAIDQDLQIWREDKFTVSDKSWQSFLESRVPNPLAALDEARRIIFGGGGAGDSESIRSVAEQAALDMPERKEAIGEALAELSGLFEGPSYEAAERTLRLLGEADAKSSSEMMSALREEMSGGGSFLDWYSRLNAALERLREELTPQ